MEPAFQQALDQVEAAMEQLLVGKTFLPIPLSNTTSQMDRIIELTNMLSGNFSEMNAFSRELSKGKLNGAVPGRRNYLAASLKELHSELSGVVWTLDQIAQGRIVDAPDFMGDISAALKKLIERMHSSSEITGQDNPYLMNSWKYHQMLLAFNHLQQMVLLVGENGRVVFLNRLAELQLGPLTTVHIEDSSKDVSALELNLSSLSSDANTFPNYHEIYDNARNCWFKIMSDKIHFPNDDSLYLHSIEDISEWKSNETKLKISAVTDHLTGIYNRSVGIKALEAALLNRDKTISAAAFVDVDSLKYVNDNFGHNEGDYVIKSISGALSTSVRDSDVVSRFGGDEFLVVFSGCGLEVAERVIGRIHSKVQAINDLGTKPYSLSFSHGMVQIDDKCVSTTHDLITLMDKKMYERKAAKRY